MILSIPMLDQFLFYLITGVFGCIWAVMRVYEIYQQIKNSRYRLALTIIESAVQKTYDTYTREIKKAREDGKLTPEERKKAFELAMQTALEMARGENIELYKILRKELLPYFIHNALQKLKLRRAR
ncbi:MAG: hypothetical protein ACP5UA_03245 [Candidatus Hydrogenedens sp.]